MLASNPSPKQRLVPSICIIALGLLVLLLSLILAILIASGDPVDFSVQAKERGIRIATYIAVFGATFFVGCVLSAGFYTVNKYLSKHAIIILAILGTIVIILELIAMPFLTACIPIVLIVLIAADIILVKFAYSRIPISEK
jgi:hypothetical protein